MTHGALPHREGARLPRSGERPHPAPGQPAALRGGLRREPRGGARPRPHRLSREHLREPEPRPCPRAPRPPRVVVALNIVAHGDSRADRCRAGAAGPRRRPRPTAASQDADPGRVLQRHDPQGHRQPQHRPERRRAGLHQRVAGQHAARRRRLRRRRWTSSTTTSAGSLSAKLTDQQEALLGCGPFFKTSCDLDGVDVLNMEGGVFFQSFPNIDGHLRPGPEQALGHVRQEPSPSPAPSASRARRSARASRTAGPTCCRAAAAPATPATTSSEDGSTTGLLQPFTGQQFQNEMAALSWNILMGVVGFSMPGTDGVQPQDFDVERAVPHGRLLLPPAAVLLDGGRAARPRGPAAQRHPRRRQRPASAAPTSCTTRAASAS